MIVRYVDEDGGTLIEIEQAPDPVHQVGVTKLPPGPPQQFRCMSCGELLYHLPGPVFCTCGGVYFERHV